MGKKKPKFPSPDQLLDIHVKIAIRMVEHTLQHTGKLHIMGVLLKSSDATMIPVIFADQSTPKPIMADMFKRTAIEHDADAALLIAPALFKTVDVSEVAAINETGLSTHADAKEVVIIQWKSKFGHRGEHLFNIVHDGKNVRLGDKFSLPKDTPKNMNWDIWFDTLFETIQ